MEPSDLGMLASLDALLQEGSVTGAARRMGISTPAMSHALARIRDRMGDEILVRSGRGMLLTPRAEALKPLIRSVIVQAERALEDDKDTEPRELERTFVIHATDYVLAVVGPEIDRILREEAPKITLRFVPNTPEDPERVRDGDSDLAVGIYGDLPQEMRSRRLMSDRFVCVVRKGHPALTGRFTLERFLAFPHIQVAPRGQPGGYIDDVLRDRGKARTVLRAVPYFITALQLVTKADYVLTISERMARRCTDRWKLEILDVPLKLRPYALSLLWHPRVDGDVGHRFLRDVFVRAAREVASESHDAPRTRLDPSDPTSGQRRKRPKRRRD